jgi:hypothetical protein
VGVIVGTSWTARARAAEDGASEKTLVVAVEMEAGAGVNGAQVRAVIGQELRRPVATFIDGAAPPAGTDEPDLLLVGLGRERIVMSMRRHLEAGIERSVPAPADAAARLRTIAWLAGNVVRDQVSPFLRASAELGQRVSLVEAAAVSTEAGPPAPAQPPPAATEPPPMAPPSLPARSEVETLAREEPAASPRTEAEWSISATGGPAVFGRAPVSLGSFDSSVAFQLDLLKHRSDRWLWGVGVDVGPFEAVGAGLAALGGRGWRWDKIRLEANAGLGIESVTLHDVHTTVSNTSGEPSSDTVVVVRTGYVPYGRVVATLSRELTSSWDVVLRVGANLAFAGTHENPIFASGLGLRLNLR